MLVRAHALPVLLITPKMLCILHRHCGRLAHCRFTPWAAFTLAYFTLMRQSNLLSTALAGWGSPHTIQRQDIVPALGGLRVTIASSKTIKAKTQAVAILAPSIPDSSYSPVAAWIGLCNSPRPPRLPSEARGPPHHLGTHLDPPGRASRPASPAHPDTPSTVTGGEPPRAVRHRAWTSPP